MTPITYFTVNDKTLFIPLRYVYPECSKLIAPHPQMYPLKCLTEDGCPANMQCMDYLAKRVFYLFAEVVPTAEMLIAYYKHPDRPQSLRGAVFHRGNNIEPYVQLLNPYGFRKFQREGSVFQWTPTDSYVNIGAARNIIPVKGLIRDC